MTREDPTAKTKYKKKGLTPKKQKQGSGRSAFSHSPGGPGAVRSTNFVLVGHATLDARALNKTHFSLEGVPFLSPLHGTLHLRLTCLIESHVEERGFLVSLMEQYLCAIMLIFTLLTLHVLSVSRYVIICHRHRLLSCRRCSRMCLDWVRGIDAGSR